MVLIITMHPSTILKHGLYIQKHVSIHSFFQNMVLIITMNMIDY